jgi:radical SAM protein with 4Fe4S-binding SPASM domain
MTEPGPGPQRRSVRAVLDSIVRPGAPIAAMIEISDRCNEVCIHCYQVQGEKGEMTTEQLKRALDELAALGVLFLTISGGEATLRRDFLEIVAHARQLRFSVKIYTNGLTMTRELAGRLAALAVQEVQISLYSHRAEAHDWVTRVPGSWQRTVDGARHLVEAGVRVLLKTPLMAFNVDEYPEWVAFVKSLGAQFSLDSVVTPREDGHRDPTALRITDASYLRARRDEAFGGTPPSVPEVPLSGRPCGACSKGIHIEANGEIRPCGLLPVPLGNVLEDDGLRKAWLESEQAKRVRSLTWGDIRGCRVCDLRRYCGRCFANSRSESGDALGPYESACRRARLEYEVIAGRPPEVRASEVADGSVGPYREVEPGVLEAFEDGVTDHDRELREKLEWVVLGGGPAPEPPRAMPGDLVQLRRPGRGPSLERLPDGSAAK